MKIIINVYNKREGEKNKKGARQAIISTLKSVFWMNSYKQTEKRISVKMADF